jgi:hypothetical protein
MEPTTIIAIVLVLAVVGFFILRTSMRRSQAENVPSLTYVDETLLDLVRTKQIAAAIDYYQKHSGASAEDADRAIQHFVPRPESLMLLVRLRNSEQAPLYMDNKLMELLQAGRQLKAVNYYLKATNCDIREAQIAVGALVANPEMKFKS